MFEGDLDAETDQEKGSLDLSNGSFSTCASLPLWRKR